MTTQELVALRLLHQRIARTDTSTPEAVALHMGAMQAQDYYGVLWSLGLRTGCREAEVVQATAEQRIIRTWPQRGTLHVVPPADAKWLVGLSADRLLKGAARRRASLGLDDHILQTAKRALVQALHGKLLTRPEVMGALEQAGVSTASGRGYHILWYLSQTGVTYIGPMRDKQQTIGLLDELVPHAADYSREQGLAELAKRYFVSHGPATVQDFMWWSGLTAADAKAGLAANNNLLTSAACEDKTYWLAKAAPPAGDPNAAFLLPGFDEYILGYKDRSAVLHASHAPKIVPGGNGMFLPTIVVHGQIVGTWKRTIKKDHVAITLAPFSELGKADLRQLEAPAALYGAFLGLPPKLTIVRNA
jgi:Winged helix DNA-binding domain